MRFTLATPYFAAEYVFSHMGLHPSLRKSIATKYYMAGHMFYIDPQSRQAFSTDVKTFYQSAQ